jgi:hypothetical protein
LILKKTKKRLFLQGGAVTTFTALREKSLKGVLYSSPMLKVMPEVAKPHLVAISKFLSQYLPKLPIIGEGLDQSLMSHNKSSKNNFLFSFFLFFFYFFFFFSVFLVVEKFLNDPLCYNSYFKINQAYVALRATEEIQAQAKNVNFPFIILQSGSFLFLFFIFYFLFYFNFILFFYFILFFHGFSDDKAVDIEGAKNFHKNAASKDKRLEIFEGAFHHLMGEPSQYGGGKERAMKEAIDWIIKRI